MVDLRVWENGDGAKLWTKSRSAGALRSVIRKHSTTRGADALNARSGGAGMSRCVGRPSIAACTPQNRSRRSIACCPVLNSGYAEMSIRTQELAKCRRACV